MKAHFRILNVFTREGRLTGNPLCVFEDGEGISDADMQALARQFNLSETTFVLPSQGATARVRIFTPSYELPFAGHPNVGTGYVLAAAGRSCTPALHPKSQPLPVSRSRPSGEPGARLGRALDSHASLYSALTAAPPPTITTS